MNRILKFRVWDEEDKIFRFIDLHDNLEWLSGAILQYDERVQQFTNILDKNNQEIFEGDIVKFDISGVPHGPERENGIIGNVFFDVGFGCWCFGKEGYSFF